MLESVITRRKLLAAAMGAAAPVRPNVLVFMSDQESALLPGPADLPNRARLQRGGATFTHAFCNTPQCSAARSSLLTGLTPQHTGVLTNVDKGSLGKPLPPSMPTVGTIFRAAGYACGYFGKWHLGDAESGLSAFGFDTKGVENGDDRIAQQAAEWIRGRQGPWLAWVSVLNPHHIYSLEDVPARAGVKPPFSDLRNLAGKPGEQTEYVEKDQGRATRNYSPRDWVRYRSFYCELVERADRNLGTVLDGVAGLDSTIAVYTSDHGDALGEHGLPFKGPFMYEEEIRIPLVIRAPWALGATRERDDLVQQVDLAPTLAALAGIGWKPASDGRNLVSPSGRDAVFLEYYAKQKWVNPIRTIRTRRWKLNRYERGNRELYDLQSDPHETRNLAGQPESAGIQRDLEKRLD